MEDGQSPPLDELVRAALRRDESAFAELVKRFERAALAIAYGVLRDSAAAGDVTQEAFLRAWQRLSELNDPRRFGAWIGTIVRNMAHDQLRKRSGRNEISHELHHDSAAAPVAGNLRLVVDPAVQADRDERRRHIDAALSELDGLTRTAVALRYYEDMSSKQIGELLELSPGAVDMRLSRARTVLREKLAALAAG